MRRAIERAAGFLVAHEQRGEGAWITTQGAMLLGPKFEAWARTLQIVSPLRKTAKPDSHAAFSDVIEARLWSLRWLPERRVVKLSKPKATPVARAEARLFEDKDIQKLLATLLLAVTCRNAAPERGAQLLELLSTPGRSYLLTYQLLGLMLAYNQGCLTAAVAEPLRSRLATELFAQARTDTAPLDALAIERLAMLCYARVCNWIDPGVIARLVSEQQPSGTWGARDPHVYRTFRATEEHTAALAFYVLARSWTLRHAPGAAPKPPPAPPTQAPPAPH